MSYPKNLVIHKLRCECLQLHRLRSSRSARLPRLPPDDLALALVRGSRFEVLRHLSMTRSLWSLSRLAGLAPRCVTVRACRWRRVQRLTRGPGHAGLPMCRPSLGFPSLRRLRWWTATLARFASPGSAASSGFLTLLTLFSVRLRSGLVSCR